MATNKNALTRYKILDKCFRNPGKRYFINDLIQECNVILSELDSEFSGISRRQIFEDIAFMESSEGWSIELNRIRDGKKVFYRYFNSSFSINNMPLNELEINQLKSALNILSQFKGMPQFEWMNELIPKLRQGISDKEKDAVIIEFDSNKYLRGIANLGPLYNAVLYKKVLEVNYKPFENDEPFMVVLHPYYLKQFNNRWFLFGYNQDKNKYDWNMALDRIMGIKEIKSKYHSNSEIDWDEYFEDIIGVTKPEGSKCEKIRLVIYGKTGRYIESKPIHGSQKTKWIDDNTLQVELELIINFEFETLLLSYADSVKVISPKKFAEKIENRFANACKIYKSKLP